ncbi:MAG: hypothetical protein QNJ70_12455 [Xenococcaceae cyanobacterium MO_207.B15]|nr:hypothetical protein [Xenococcaceae cyanobacterium MO_207.B15]
MSNPESDYIQQNREYLIKQSEMLQSIISRMANNSLTIKQLGITLWTTLIGFGFTNKIPFLFILALISFLLLGLLDSYYLYLETRFRGNFHRLTKIICGYESNTIDLFNRCQGNFITLEKLTNNQAIKLYLETLTSWANIPYILVLVITLIIWQVGNNL